MSDIRQLESSVGKLCVMGLTVCVYLCLCSKWLGTEIIKYMDGKGVRPPPPPEAPAVDRVGVKNELWAFPVSRRR